MAITIELTPEEERRLRRQAETAGQDVVTYLLVGAGLRRPASKPLTQEEREALLDEFGETAPPEAPLTDEEWERLADEAADIVGPDVPPLSDHAVSREGIYGGRL